MLNFHYDELRQILKSIIKEIVYCVANIEVFILKIIFETFLLKYILKVACGKDIATYL